MAQKYVIGADDVRRPAGTEEPAPAAIPEAEEQLSAEQQPAQDDPADPSIQQPLNPSKRKPK